MKIRRARKKNAGNKSKNGLLALGTLLAVSCLAFTGELWLRKTEKFAAYWEKNDLGPPSADMLVAPWIFVHREKSTYIARKREFTQRFDFNEEGLIGELPKIPKAKDELRVVIIGDSFTQGTGDVDSLGYVGRLQLGVSSRKGPPKITVINGGKDGSDPIFGFELLRRRLLKFQPDLVLITLNASDFHDIERRGGRERFNPDGSLRIRKPWWAPAFTSSHLVRALLMGFLGYNWEFHSPSESQAARVHTLSEVEAIGREANEFGAMNGFRFRYLIHPTPLELRYGALSGGLAEAETRLRAAGVEFIDLLPRLLAHLHEPIENGYYWPNDGHYSGKGYQLFAQALLEELDRNGLLKRGAR